MLADASDASVFEVFEAPNADALLTVCGAPDFTPTFHQLTRKEGRHSGWGIGLSVATRERVVLTLIADGSLNLPPAGALARDGGVPVKLNAQGLDTRRRRTNGRWRDFAFLEAEYAKSPALVLSTES